MNFQAVVLRQVGAKLCRTLSLKTSALGLEDEDVPHRNCKRSSYPLKDTQHLLLTRSDQPHYTH